MTQKTYSRGYRCRGVWTIEEFGQQLLFDPRRDEIAYVVLTRDMVCWLLRSSEIPALKPGEIRTYMSHPMTIGPEPAIVYYSKSGTHGAEVSDD